MATTNSRRPAWLSIVHSYVDRIRQLAEEVSGAPVDRVPFFNPLFRQSQLRVGKTLYQLDEATQQLPSLVTVLRLKKALPPDLAGMTDEQVYEALRPMFLDSGEVVVLPHAANPNVDADGKAHPATDANGQVIARKTRSGVDCYQIALRTEDPRMENLGF